MCQLPTLWRAAACGAVLCSGVLLTSVSHATQEPTQRQFVMDDGFTFFDAFAIKQRNAAGNGFVAKGWALTSHLRAFGDYPQDSFFKIVVKGNGKALVEVICATKNIPKNTRDGIYESVMTTATGNTCSGDEDQTIEKPGKYAVDVYFVSGDDDSERLLRTYKIDVREGKKIRPGGMEGVSNFYIQRHAEAPVAILQLRPPQGSPFIGGSFYGSRGGTPAGHMDVYFNMVTDRYQMTFKGLPKVRCFVNDERIKIEHPARESKLRASFANRTRERNSHSMMFGFYGFDLPLVWEPKNDNTYKNNMALLPGSWKCELRNVRETVRTFYWVVEGNGLPQMMAEQRGGNINLALGAYLVPMAIPKGGSSLDYSLQPQPGAGVFYGIPVKSKLLKQAVSAVPTKGPAYVDELF